MPRLAPLPKLSLPCGPFLRGARDRRQGSQETGNTARTLPLGDHGGHLNFVAPGQVRCRELRPAPPLSARVELAYAG